jgi:hypothetical protein
MLIYKKVVLATIVGLSLLTTAVNADVDKGKRIYLKKLKSKCGFSGADFAAKHTQREWKDAKESDKLSEVMIESCPAGKDFFSSEKFKKKFSFHLYDFVYEFASDSGNVPSC